MTERTSQEQPPQSNEITANTDWLTIADGVFEVPKEILDAFRTLGYSITTEGDDGRYVSLIDEKSSYKMVFDQQNNSVAVFRKKAGSDEFSDRIFDDNSQAKPTAEKILFMRRTGRLPKK